MMMFELPSELILGVLEFLPASDLATIQTLSRDWNEFLTFHQASIYHNCAVLHGYAGPRATLEEAKRKDYGSDWLVDVESWREYCVKYRNLEHRWVYRVPPATTTLPVPGPHRLKIDEEHGLLLHTNSSGGLSVKCSRTLIHLWQIPRLGVRRYAHLEYSGGFAIFDRYDQSHEVWIKGSIAHNFETHRHVEPSQRTILASYMDNLERNESHGAYVPHLILRNPVPTRAYRSVFPELLVASEANTTAHIWNIVTGQIIEAYSLNDALGHIPEDLLELFGLDQDFFRSINYVELSSTHMFICFSAKLIVFARASETFDERTRFALPNGPPWKEAVPVLILPHALENSEKKDRVVSQCRLIRDIDSVRGSFFPIVHRPGVTPLRVDLDRGIDFVAVHVSPDGKSFIAVADEGQIYYARNFGETGASSPEIWVVDTHITIYHLAFDGKKVAFATDAGVFLFHIDPLHPADDATFPAKGIYLVENIVSSRHLNTISSLQMTKTAIWYCQRPVRRLLPGEEQDQPLSPQIVRVDYANDS